MKTEKIIKLLEKKFPVEHAEEWDNVGLLVGDHKKEIKKIQFSLDITEKVLKNAIKNKVDMIITHHPVIFRAIKSVTSYSVLGKNLMLAIKNDINIYCMHTNLDSTIGGLNDFVLSKLGASNIKILTDDTNEFGIGRYFDLEKEASINEYVKLLKKKLGIKNLRFIGYDINKKIKRIGIINGSAMSFWKKAKNFGVDLFITGDVSYHDALDAREAKLNVIDFGHYESEHFFYELILNELNGNDLEFLIYNDEPVFNFI